MSVHYLELGHNCFLPHNFQSLFTNHPTIKAVIFWATDSIFKQKPTEFLCSVWRTVFQRHVEKILNRRFHYFTLSGIFHACLVASVMKEGMSVCSSAVCLQDTNCLLILRTSQCVPDTAVGRTGCFFVASNFFWLSSEWTSEPVLWQICGMDDRGIGRYATLHCTALHYTTLHYATLHYTTLHYTALHCTALHYTTQHRTRLHYTTLH